jgi:AraC family transcriptional regulator, positive regulator of tynA and feaB
MLQREIFQSTPELDYEGWREALRSQFGRYNPVVEEPKTFVGRARSRKPYGFVAMDLCCNAHRIERTERDVRYDGVDHYFVLFQVIGASRIIQNDQTVQLGVGDAALVDSTLPGTYVAEDTCAQWLSLQLPRRSLVCHLGFEPHGIIPGRAGTDAGRVLFDLLREADTGGESQFPRLDPYMQLAVYDLIGAQFAPSDPPLASVPTEKLFKRIRDSINDHFANPAFGPREVAAEAGISLRYLQKLFAARNSTCSHFIDSVRLDHAARLLLRRKLLGTRQPVSEIAYACGFADHTNFARKFRRWFGHTPGSHSPDPSLNGCAHVS